jgi:two-component system, sensor histidine kinase PdtaS
MLAGDVNAERGIDVESIDANFPVATVVPLGFIVNELVTNAIKHGRGRIAIKLEASPHGGYALSVFNERPPLPEGFDPSASKGLGM